MDTKDKLNELNDEAQQRIVCSCNNCKRNFETRYNCTSCNELDLCVNCLDKLDLEDSETCDQNQTNTKKCRRLSIQRYLQLLMHACPCRDTDCRFPSCQGMKRIIRHAKCCKRQVNGVCPICTQLIALTCYHAKYCQKNTCPVPFCCQIKLKLEDPLIQQTLQQALILKRRIATTTKKEKLGAVTQSSPGNSRVKPSTGPPKQSN